MTARRHAFTLLEMIIAIAVSAVVLAALYVNFSVVIHLRDKAAEHARTARVRARTVTILRNDLRHALISGGVLAKSLQGSESGHSSSFPGYLKITTTTASDLLDTPSADVQQVEYYIIDDPDATDRKSGLLVRAVETNLLATVAEDPREESLLHGIEALTVEFYDEAQKSWAKSWEVTDDDKTLPSAVRVRLQPESAEGQRDALPPIEIYVPWLTQAEIDPAATPAPGP